MRRSWRYIRRGLVAIAVIVAVAVAVAFVVATRIVRFETGYRRHEQEMQLLIECSESRKCRDAVVIWRKSVSR